MAEEAKKKGGKGLIIGIALVVVILGAVFGLATVGMINIPGVTPKKKPHPTPVAKAKPKPPAQTKKEPEVVPPSDIEKPLSPDAIKQGAAKLAEVWNEMPTDKLQKVIEKWKPEDLAVILAEMDPTKVADMLGAMKPDVASKVSLELKKIASQAQTE